MNLTSPSSGWQRIEEVERASVIVWYLLFGVAMVAGTSYLLWRDFNAAPAGVLGLVGIAFSAPGPILFFLLGLAFVGGSIYTAVDKARNKLWLDVETPLTVGGKLRAILSSNRPLVATSSVELEATLACK